MQLSSSAVSCSFLNLKTMFCYSTAESLSVHDLLNSGFELQDSPLVCHKSNKVLPYGAVFTTANVLANRGEFIKVGIDAQVSLLITKFCLPSTVYIV